MLRSTALDDSRDRFLVSNDLGEFAIVPAFDLGLLRDGTVATTHPRYDDYLAKSFIERAQHGGAGLEEAVLRTRKSFLLHGPSLHIFVVTLRCDHSCAYCQVSRAALNARGYDMSIENADAAIERVFESSAWALTIEFQGGEPTLRFDLIRHIVERVQLKNETERRDIHFSLVSTLHHLSDDDLIFCRDNGIHISTSIDGPAALHNLQRPIPTKDAWERTVASLSRARAILGHQGVVALPTTSRAALSQPRAIVDTYLELEFNSIFLRPMSPYGFARRTRKAIGYEVPEYLAFYEQVLDYLLELNAAGTEISDSYTAVMLRHILTPFGSNYLDLRSPAGAGLGVLVYNYDGVVYPADEARMAAETGDARFALGTVDMPLSELLNSAAMSWLSEGAIAEDLPGCRDCAFVPFCGADPVYHASLQGDPVGDRETSEFCQRNLGLFRILFLKIAQADPETMKTFQAWAFGRSRAEIMSMEHSEA